MKFKFQKKNIPAYIAILIVLLCIIMIAAYFIRMAVIYFNGSEMETDKISGNINVMLTRPDNWEKIETGKISLTQDDLLKIDGSTATIPVTAELARQFCDATDENISGFIDHHTTHYAYRNLIYTKRNPQNYGNIFEKYLIFATEPSVNELQMAEEAGVSLDVKPIAMDGFVFITHKDNPVDSLTVEQIQKIYSGEITNWKEVGGNDAEIIPYQRESNSGSQTAMEQLVMKDVQLMEPAVGYRVETGMAELVEKIGEYQNRENSIGYTYYYYINNLYRNENIKVLNIDGISPSNENLINHSYPFTTSYYAVLTDGCPEKMKELRDYLLTDEGQEIIKLAGYCPVAQNGDQHE